MDIQAESLYNTDKRCLFVHVPQLGGSSKKNWHSFINTISMGVFSLAHELDKNGFESKIMHLAMVKSVNTIFSVSEFVHEYKIKIVALSLHWHFQSSDVIEVAKAIKRKNPNCKIILGGYTASCFAKEIIESYPFIDFIIKGEGELPIVELAKKIFSDDKNYLEIPNLCYMKDGKAFLNSNLFVATDEDLDSYKFYDLKYLIYPTYYLKFPHEFVYHKIGKNTERIKKQLTYSSITTICLGRGCPGNCTWCGGGHEAIKKITGRDFISWRKPKEVAKEIINLKKEYNIAQFNFCFDPTPKDRSKILELFSLLGKSGEKISLFFETFGLPDEKFLTSFKKNLKKNSVVAISPEFGDEKIRFIHKKDFSYTNKEMEDILDFMEKEDISSILFFTSIFGESDTSKQTTKKYIKKLEKKYKKCKFYYIPISHFEPGAPWTLNPQKYGFNLKPKNFKYYYEEHSRYKAPSFYENFIL